METKINVAEARVNGDWCNIKTSEGKEVSVMLSKCPKLKAQLEPVPTTPFELTVNLVDKNGKLYGWDLEEKKGGKGQPRNEKAIIAQSSYNYAINYLIGCKTVYDLDELDKTAKHIFDKVCQLRGVQ